MKKIILILATFVSSFAFSGAPTCHTHSSGPYCQYTGQVEKVYVNTGGHILLYFDVLMDSSVPSNVGLNVSNYFAAIYPLNDFPEFGNLLYSTMLAAQATGRNVTVQMRKTLHGYLEIDRIWLDSP